MPWLELSLVVRAEQQPSAEEALDELGALSITLQDADAETPDEQAIFEPGVGELPLWPVITLNALFDAGTDRRGLIETLGELLSWLEPAHVVFRDVADQDWERVWMDQFKPMAFGRRLWIYPWNIEPPEEDELAGHSSASMRVGRSDASCDRGTSASMRVDHSSASCDRGTSASMRVDHSSASCDRGTSASMRVVVRLDPGLAFGSGTHPTTALCLEWLDGLSLAGKRVIDYGCGSGVLAIAALKLGAASAVGIDNDPQALIASADNAQRNGVADRLAVFLPDDAVAAAAHPDSAALAHTDTSPADVFIANILAGPLATLAPTFAALAKPGAPFAISGILAGQQDELLQRYDEWFDALRVDTREDWVRISGRRRA